MKVFLLSFLLLFIYCNTCLAQTSVNVYWVKESNLPAKETIYYDEAKPLDWNNFEGEPQAKGNTAAITMSGFGYRASMKSNGGSATIDIGVYCYFSKPKSWVKPGRTTEYILSHEQHHFDISYLVAAIFMEKVKTAKLTTANLNDVLPQLYKDCCSLLESMQNEYDGQTKNGQIPEEQATWHKNILNRLAALRNK